MTKRATAWLLAASLCPSLAGCDSQEIKGCAELGALCIPIAPVGLVYGAYRASQRAHHAPSASATRAWAEKGDALAQFALCQMYSDGDDVAKDDAEAANWCRRSAEQGLGKAQIQIGLFYETGRGVAQDNVQADVWYNLATISEKSFDTVIDDAVKRRDDLEKRMAPEQIAEARRRAWSWLAR